MSRNQLITICTSLILAASCLGQTCTDSAAVGCVIPNLFGGERGIRLPVALPGMHQEHFFNRPEYDQNFLPLNKAVATQLTLLPIPSPASGFTYSFDRAAGVHTRTAQSFGPILTERGETIGQKKLYFGFSYQRFRFNELDGHELNNLPVVLPHSSTGPAFNDIITANNDIELKINQFTIFGTIGVTNRFDFSVAVPIMDVRMRATSRATINRIGNTGTTGDLCGPNRTPCHSFDPNNLGDLQRSFFNPSNPPQTANGIGDVILRFKHNLVDSDRVALSFLTDLRLPTGDEREFLGSGAVGVKPFFALTLKGGEVAPNVVFAPHINFGFQWNGDSVMAGDIAANTKASLPEQLFYTAGTDIGLTRRFTVAADFIGQRIVSGTRLGIGSYTAANNTQYPQMQFSNDSFGINSFAVGFKWNLVKELILQANVMIQLDSGGLRQRVVPMIGLTHSF
jgi:hypothetical protein